MKNNNILHSSLMGREATYTIHDYMTVEALEDGLTVKLSLNNCEYCVDGSFEWISLTKNTETVAINLGQTLSFRASGLKPTSSSYKGIGTFTISKRCNLLGNVTSMAYGDDARFNTSVGNYFFSKLFEGCTTIISVSDNFIPSNTLGSYCCAYMFKDCTNLIKPPKLPASSCSSYCYSNMFYGCKSLTYIPELKISSSSSYLYYYMFGNCTGLQELPKMSFKCSGSYAYSYMFYGCSGLTTINLTISSSASYLCYGMFESCSNLANVTLTWTNASSSNIAQRMFANCTSLVNAENISIPKTSYGGYEMFYGCSSLTKPPVIPSTTNSYSYYGMFKNCTSLVNAPLLPATTLSNYCYGYMFSGCTSLITAPALPASTMSSYCYYFMFNECNNLVNVPTLNSTALAEGCYYAMFINCKSIVNTPILPATTLKSYCYRGMFEGCTSIVTAPELPATILGSGCYLSMFYGCTGLVNIPTILQATTLADACYRAMFYNCSKLINAPVLPASKLKTECYQSMFYGCSKINYIKMLAKDASATNCMYNWVSGVSTTGTFVKHFDADWDITGVNGVPIGWELLYDFNPVECTSLTITAKNVTARDTHTTITYTATMSGYDEHNNSAEYTITKSVQSEEFPQNTSYTDTVLIELSFTFMGVTATTTITQEVWKDQYYEVTLNNNWRLSSSILNPDDSTYEGVYESYSNYNIDGAYATMYIDIVGYTSFKLYIRSYAESNYDYVMVSQPDQTINGNSSYSNTTLVKAHTRGSQSSGTAISNYKLVEFTGLDGNEHKITIVYRKDGSSHSGTDRGYVLIPINQ